MACSPFPIPPPSPDATCLSGSEKKVEIDEK